ncbi:MAG: hypothetical protein OEY94_06945, partial [Alphaproteobacteria bacterium]|nr:hypothetical protein [Alphaproteobacteria bacterium]
SHAQTSDDDIIPLGEMLNPDLIKPPVDKKAPVTPSDYANAYFEKCNSEDQVVFTPSEQEVLCACSAANMSSLLSVREFKLLDVDSKEGDVVRQNVMLHAYAPCARYVVPEYARKDCFSSPQIKNVSVGRESVCLCAGDRVEKVVSKTSLAIIERFHMHHPDEINFLKDYFMSPDYEFYLRHSVGQCLYEQNYKAGR